MFLKKIIAAMALVCLGTGSIVKVHASEESVTRVRLDDLIAGIEENRTRYRAEDRDAYDADLPDESEELIERLFQRCINDICSYLGNSVDAERDERLINLVVAVVQDCLDEFTRDDRVADSAYDISTAGPGFLIASAIRYVPTFVQTHQDFIIDVIVALVNESIDESRLWIKKNKSRAISAVGEILSVAGSEIASLVRSNTVLMTQIMSHIPIPREVISTELWSDGLNVLGRLCYWCPDQQLLAFLDGQFRQSEQLRKDVSERPQSIIAAADAQLVITCKHLIAALVNEKNHLLGVEEQLTDCLTFIIASSSAQYYKDQAVILKKKLKDIQTKRRVGALHVLDTAWVGSGGNPEPLIPGADHAARLARTLKLRRFCRIGTGKHEGKLVEPYGQGVVWFL